MIGATGTKIIAKVILVFCMVSVILSLKELQKARGKKYFWETVRFIGNVLTIVLVSNL